MMDDNYELSRRSVLGAAGLAMIGGLATPAAADHDIGTGAQYPDTCEGPGFNDTPQLPDSPWQVHDACRPQPPAVDSGEPAFPDPPADATVLMSDGEDGSITLDDWNNSSSWEVNDNYVIVGDEPLVSRDGLGMATITLNGEPRQVSPEAAKSLAIAAFSYRIATKSKS